MTIRTVLVDDHPIVLAGLARLFGTESDIEILDSVTSGNDALRAIRQFKPDVVVLDLRMPGKDGIAVLTEMQHEMSPPKIVVLTAADGDDVLTAIRLGARGVVLKDMAPRLLVDCVRTVHAGGRWIERSVAGSVVDRLLHRESRRSTITGSLTPREMEVARMIASGLASKHVASRLAITEGTTKLHLHHVYAKLNVRGRVGLVRYLQRHGLD